MHCFTLERRRNTPSGCVCVQVPIRQASIYLTYLLELERCRAGLLLPHTHKGVAVRTLSGVGGYHMSAMGCYVNDWELGGSSL